MLPFHCSEAGLSFFHDQVVILPLSGAVGSEADSWGMDLTGSQGQRRRLPFKHLGPDIKRSLAVRAAPGESDASAIGVELGGPFYREAAMQSTKTRVLVRASPFVVE